MTMKTLLSLAMNDLVPLSPEDDADPGLGLDGGGAQYIPRLKLPRARYWKSLLNVSGPGCWSLPPLNSGR